MPPEELGDLRRVLLSLRDETEAWLGWFAESPELVQPEIIRLHVAKVSQALGQMGDNLRVVAGKDQARLAELGTAMQDAAGNLGAESPSGLSEREMQIARLAAKGASISEIAELLQLSRRTVDSLLHSVYEKLDVSSRAGITSALGRGL